MKIRLPWGGAAVTALLLTASANAQIGLTELVTVNLDSTANAANPEFIGSNPSGVAWDGTDLYITGFNNAPTAQAVGVVRVADPLNAAAPAADPAFFSIPATPSFRGFAGVDVRGTTLVVTYDDGSANALGQTTWNTATLTQIAAKNVRGSAGPAFDPGFAGANADIASLAFGSGRRILDADPSLAPIFDTTNGMIVINTGGGSLWRDVDFDPTTGNFYGRRSNDVVAAVRTGGNSSMAGTLLVDNFENGAFNNQQNVCFVNSPTFGDFVIYNDRVITSTLQAFDMIIQAVDTSGTPLTIDFNGFTAPVGNAAYDFDYHAPSNTLAITDADNRNVTIFSVSNPAVLFGDLCFGDGGDGMGCTFCPCGNDAVSGSMTGCLNSSGNGARLLPSGNPSIMTDTLRMEMTGGPPFSFAILSSGNAVAPANAVNPCFGLDSGIQSPTLDGLRCAVQAVQRHGSRPTSATGSVGMTSPGWGPPNGPPGGLAAQGGFVAGQTRFYQVIYRETPGLVCGTGLNTSQAVQVNFQP